MISYHGSDEALTVVNGGTGNGIYLTADRAIAEQYARLTAGRLNSAGTPTLLTITLADTANIADKWDAEAVIDAVANDECTGFDQDAYSYWAIIEMNEIRDALAAAGYDGITLQDTAPDGQDHESVLVWNAAVLAITATATLDAA